MILAGTSGMGACGECGAQFEYDPDLEGWLPACECASDSGMLPALVLDPFCGTGTTGKVCRAHGRRFVGLDLSAAFLHGEAVARIESQIIAMPLVE